MEACGLVAHTVAFCHMLTHPRVGMHKHFRMIALSTHLRHHGYDPHTEVHTRVPGIWEKLRTLYDLDTIDERENDFEVDDDKDKAPWAGFSAFSLPESDYGEEMWDRRLVKDEDGSDRGSSPPRLNMSQSPPRQRKGRKRGSAVAKVRASTVEDTDEARSVRSSPAPSSVVRGGRSARATRGSISTLKAEQDDGHESKDRTGDEEQDDEGGDEAEDDTGDGEEAEEEESDDQEEEDNDDVPLVKPTRGGGRGRGRGAGRGRTRAATRKGRRRK